MRKMSNVLLQFVLVIQLIVPDFKLGILRTDLDASTLVHFTLGELSYCLVYRLLHILVIVML